ncbi:MAG: hypothetical protein H6708_14880 [Kofleriaceae bacterium]|nr:hypothetical protein [Kofleriaceae bacterium]
MTEPTTLAPYPDAATHAHDELRLTGMLAARAVARGRREGWLPGAGPAGDAAADDDASVRELFTRIERRLARGRELGATLAMDVLRQRLALTLGEQRVVWALVGYDLDPRLRQLLRALSTEDGPGIAIGALMALLYEDAR